MVEVKDMVVLQKRLWGNTPEIFLSLAGCQAGIEVCRAAVDPIIKYLLDERGER
jgi:hypothetical protein